MKTQKRYLIITPFASAQVVTAILQVHKLDMDVALTNSGAVLMQDVPVPEFTDWDIAELLGDTPTAQNDTVLDAVPQQTAQVLSKISEYGVVLLVAEIGENIGVESGISGVVNAYRFIAGNIGEKLSAGLLLNSVDGVVEDLLLGKIAIKDLPTYVDPVQAQELIAEMLQKIVDKTQTSEKKTEEQE